MKRFSFIKRPRVFIPLLIAIILVIMIVVIIRNLNAPAVGSISQTPPAQAEQVDRYAKTGTYRGKYISFIYPPHFKKVPSGANNSELEVVDYHTTDLSGKQISIEVMRSGFATSGDIQYRREHKELYTENDSRMGLEFTKKDGSEDTFFLQHGDLLASVSATAPGGLDNEAYFVASSLKWLAN